MSYWVNISGGGIIGTCGLNSAKLECIYTGNYIFLLPCHIIFLKFSGCCSHSWGIEGKWNRLAGRQNRMRYLFPDKSICRHAYYFRYRYWYSTLHIHCMTGSWSESSSVRNHSWISTQYVGSQFRYPHVLTTGGNRECNQMQSEVSGTTSRTSSLVCLAWCGSTGNAKTTTLERWWWKRLCFKDFDFTVLL